MPSANTLIEATAVVRDGRLKFHDRQLFDELVRQLKEGWTVQIEIRHLRANRSIQQSRYYWGVVVHLLTDYTGYSAEEMHEFLKAKFLPKHLAVSNSNGVIVDHFVIGGSTRKLNTVEFNEYIAQIQQWAAETVGVYIPDPGEEVSCQ